MRNCVPSMKTTKVSVTTRGIPPSIPHIPASASRHSPALHWRSRNLTATFLPDGSVYVFSWTKGIASVSARAQKEHAAEPASSIFRKLNIVSYSHSLLNLPLFAISLHLYEYFFGRGCSLQFFE